MVIHGLMDSGKCLGCSVTGQRKPITESLKKKMDGMTCFVDISQLVSSATPGLKRPWAMGLRKEWPG